MNSAVFRGLLVALLSFFGGLASKPELTRHDLLKLSKEELVDLQHALPRHDDCDLLLAQEVFLDGSPDGGCAVHAHDSVAYAQGALLRGQARGIDVHYTSVVSEL